MILVLRNIVGRLLGLAPNELHESWDTVLLIPIGLCAVVISAVLTGWPLERGEVRNLALLCLVALFLFAFVKDKRSCTVGVLYFIALKWSILAFLLFSCWGALIASVHLFLAFLSPGVAELLAGQVNPASGRHPEDGVGS